MATITDFKGKLRAGGARANQFRVSVAFPPVVGAAPLIAENLSFLCNATTLPAITVDNITVPFRGRPVNFAGERSFAPWSITVLNDNDFIVRNAFERWSAFIANYDQTQGAQNPADYQFPLTVTQLDRNENATKQYRFFDAYPIELGAIALAYDNPNIQTFEVTFQYNYYIPLFNPTAG